MGIDINTLLLDVDNLAYSGIVLNAEQRAALQTSLVVQRDQYKFSRIYYWGKIIGTKEDYFIAQGVGSNELTDRKSLYSHDCVRWRLLNPPAAEHLALLEICKGRFTGDPSNEFECKTLTVVGDGDEEHIDEDVKHLKEEDRLAATIHRIDQDTLIVPRGAFLHTPTGDVVKNRIFEGLSPIEAAKMGNYYHFVEAINLKEKSLLHRANLDRAIDFLDPIDEDQPKRCWSIQFERGSALVLLRSLKWPGASFFHVPDSISFGSLYYGIGEVNKDLPFMI